MNYNWLFIWGWLFSEHWLWCQTHDLICPHRSSGYTMNTSSLGGCLVPIHCAPQAAVIKAIRLHSHLLTRSQLSHSSVIYISSFSSRESCFGHSVSLLSAHLELLLGFGGVFLLRFPGNQHCYTATWSWWSSLWAQGTAEKRSHWTLQLCHSVPPAWQ